MLRLGLWRSEQGRGLGLAACRQPEGARVWCASIKGVQEEAWADQRGKMPLLGVREERGGTSIGASFSAHALRWQSTAYMSSRGRYEPPLPSWTPEVGADRCHY